jgi:hypothetical protein
VYRQHRLLLAIARRGVGGDPSSVFAGRPCGRRVPSEGADGSLGDANGHLYVASARRCDCLAQEGRLLGRAHQATRADHSVERHRRDPPNRRHPKKLIQLPHFPRLGTDPRTCCNITIDSLPVVVFSLRFPISQVEANSFRAACVKLGRRFSLVSTMRNNELRRRKKIPSASACLLESA